MAVTPDMFYGNVGIPINLHRFAVLVILEALQEIAAVAGTDIIHMERKGQAFFACNLERGELP